ncbi:MAG: ATP-dependent RNA helicase [Gammaproteobacteria bacterium]|nr:MAG: ATP-dependent RNA helicase [Gammaproteobacteria bacterium]
MTDSAKSITGTFADLSLSKPVMKAIDEVGYETPSPIQSRMIPYMLQGKDVIGQAQTGTGKTAAFALPILSMIDIKNKAPQVLVLTPTRELAIQVAEAFQRYACHIKGFHVLPIYGGQEYGSQLRALKRGPQVIVGTPGRVMDHLRKRSLKLDALSTLVLDEADEMLRMGFIDDVEWILEQTPDKRQIALFSATMPSQIHRIAKRYLNSPAEVMIKNKTATASTISQRYWMVSGTHKLDALTRILEAEPHDGIIIFVRTKTATSELAEKLQARGYSAAAINGDMQQSSREQTIEKLKKGRIDILIATDVAARGLDVERISHVINYDIPYDTESYIHRIGRTGRAGRSGNAILFVAPRERRMFYAIEKATNKKIDRMELPSAKVLNDKRVDKFRQQITDVIAEDDFKLFTDILEQYQQEHNVPALQIAAALAKIAQGDEPLLVKDKPQSQQRDFSDRDDRDSGGGRSRRDRDGGPRKRNSRAEKAPDEGMARFRIECGHKHQVMPGNIVGAIANEAGLDSKFIGRINIFDDYSTVDMPDKMPKEVFAHLQKVRVGGQMLKITRLASEGSSDEGSSGKRSKTKSFKGKGKNAEASKKGFAKRSKSNSDKKPSRRKSSKD